MTKLYRTQNYLFDCGHVMGIVVGSKPRKLCPYCSSKGDIILRFLRRCIKKKNKKSLELLEEKIFRETNYSIKNNAYNIIKEYL